MKTADKFTCVRLFFAPLFFLLYMIPVWTGHLGTVSVFILIPLLAFAEFTDYLDGHFARKNNEVSDFGKLFDPFADVVLHLTAFFCYVSTGYMPVVVLVFIFYREFGMHFIRMVALKKGVTIAARKGGKLKTVLYIVSGCFSLAVESLIRLGLNISSYLLILKNIGICLYVFCLVASYVSFIDYLIHFREVLSDSDKADKKVK